MVKTINICRCCLNIECYRDISTEYFWAGKIEVYEQMLMNTFNLVITYQEGGGPSSGSRLICNECIKKLREATEFKQQVLRNEEKIEKYLSELLNYSMEESDYNSKNEEKKQLDIKIETNQRHDIYIMNNGDACLHDIESDVDVFDRDTHNLNDDNDTDDIQIKQEDVTETQFLNETNIENLQSNNKTKIETLEEKKQAVDDEDNAPMVDLIKVENKSTVKTDKIKPGVGNKNIAPKEDALKLKQMMKNTVNLMWHSNGAVLFKTRQNLYKCLLCNREFVKLKLLRDHVAEHTREEIIHKVKKIKTYRNVDISSLSCRMCDTSMNDFEELSIHLSKKHQVEITKHKHLLVPYKTEQEFRCLLCNEVFKRLCFLKKHMNTHYSHHVCEICGDSFINHIELYQHKKIHKSYKCVICNETFEKLSKLTQHKKKVHNKITNYISYCPECSETFKFSYMLEMHKIEKHGKEKPKLIACDECDRSFSNLNAKKIHVRAVHWKEKNFSCDICPASFFTKYDRMRHEKTHSSECQFSCELCLAKFKAKDSLRRHVRKQHGEDKIKR